MVYLDNKIETKIRKFFNDNCYGKYTADRIYALFYNDKYTVLSFILFLDKLTTIKEEQKIIRLSVHSNSRNRNHQSIIEVNLTKPFLKKRIGKTCWLYSRNL